jgi:RNA polymerase sigma factor (sigma-70 family)
MAIALELCAPLSFPPPGCENAVHPDVHARVRAKLEASTVSVEHALVARALEGDGQAFASLVEPHLSMLYRIAARACGSRALAEDAVQEALTLAYQRLDRYTPGTSLKAFLAAIAVRKAQTLLRTERRRRAREDAADAPERLAGPAELLSAERTAARVRKALARLPKKRREVALLRLDAGMSYGEIADALSTSEGSARVLVHLALKEIKDELKDLLDSENGHETAT